MTVATAVASSACAPFIAGRGTHFSLLCIERGRRRVQTASGHGSDRSESDEGG